LLDVSTRTPDERPESNSYEIRLAARLDPRWSAWFDGLTVVNHDDGTTLIHGPVADQAALFGLLQRLRDIGVPLVSLIRVDPASHTTHR
jgi:hypothetical protein